MCVASSAMMVVGYRAEATRVERPLSQRNDFR
jgi:hypothetical protein